MDVLPHGFTAPSRIGAGSNSFQVGLASGKQLVTAQPSGPLVTAGIPDGTSQTVQVTLGQYRAERTWEESR
jgi:hypothetical protein